LPLLEATSPLGLAPCIRSVAAYTSHIGTLDVGVLHDIFLIFSTLFFL